MNQDASLSTTDAAFSTTFASVDVSGCGMGVLAAAELSKFIPSMAALTTLNLLDNPIGEAADALVGAFEQNDNLRTLLAIDEGIEVLDLSKKKVDPGQAKILGAELSLGRNTAALTLLSLARVDLFLAQV